MATYSIDAPDGNTYTIEGPDGVSQREVEDEVLRQFPSAGTPKPVKPNTNGWVDDTWASAKSAALGSAGAVAAGVLGADSTLARGLSDKAEAAGRDVSTARQTELQGQAARRKVAEATGDWTEEVKAAGQNFMESPVQAAAGAVGSMLPIAITALGGKLALGARAVTALMNSYEKKHQIQFFGVGNSGIVAQDAQHKFFRLGINTNAYSDGHMQVMSASLLGPGDCVVVISNSGRTRDLMDACDIARKNGATTIVITASGSPLASAGTIHLSADHPEGFDRYSPMVSRLLHLMIIDILATSVALRIGGATLQPMLRELKNNLRSKRYT